MPRLYDLIRDVVLVSSEYRYKVMVVLDDTIVYKLYKERKNLKTDSNYVVKFNNLDIKLEYGYTCYSQDPITWDTKLELPKEAEMYVSYDLLHMNVKFKEDGKEYETNDIFLYPLRDLFTEYGYYKYKK